MRGLIDETELYNVKIRKVDLEKLLNNEKVKRHIGIGNKVYLKDYVTGKEVGFDLLNISDKYMFDALQIGSKINKDFIHEYVHMSMFVSDLEAKGHNLKPLTKAEYESKCCKVESYIEEEYGLTLNLKEKKFKLLALNKTFELEREIDEYWELFQLIHLLVPAKYKNKAFVLGGNNEIIGVYFENGVTRVKIYDKTKQLKDEKGIELDRRYMRIEVVLKEDKKIKKVIGTNLVSSITDEQLEQGFNSIIQEDVFNKIDDYLIESQKQIQKIARQEKKRNKLNWTRNFFLKAGHGGLKYEKRGKPTEIDLLFDIEQCLEIIKKETKSNYKKRLRTLEQDIDDIKGKKNNLARYDEIKRKTFF